MSLLEQLKELENEINTPPQTPPASAMVQFMGHAVHRGLSEEAWKAQQALQESLDTRDQGYTDC